MTGYFIGIMTGTSMDAVDTALVKIHDDGKSVFCSGHSQPITDRLRQKISAAANGHDDTLNTLATLDMELAVLFSDCVNQLLKKTHMERRDITAIGSHGQTIRHCPECSPPYTLQLGNGDTLAQQTGITTVANFRQRDIALGGQGAPLAPLFHHLAFHQQGKTTVVVNLGGIANISILYPDGTIEGCDTGPANTLMDQWIFKHQQKRYDRDAAWAKQGKLNENLLSRLLDEPWLKLPPPKSTGPELFNMQWLQTRLGNLDIAPADVQRTLCEYTATTLTKAITEYCKTTPDELILCGGGAYNPLLVGRIQSLCPYPVSLSSNHGLSPDWVEASMFAWLAYRTLNGLTGNVPQVTGASRAAVLGAIHPVNDGKYRYKSD